MIPFDPYEKPISDMRLMYSAMRAMQRISPAAQKYFQCDGEFHTLNDWGDDLIASSYDRMLRFCIANSKEFKKFK